VTPQDARRLKFVSLFVSRQSKAIRERSPPKAVAPRPYRFSSSDAYRCAAPTPLLHGGNARALQAGNVGRPQRMEVHHMVAPILLRNFRLFEIFANLFHRRDTVGKYPSFRLEFPAAFSFCNSATSSGCNGRGCSLRFLTKAGAASNTDWPYPNENRRHSRR